MVVHDDAGYCRLVLGLEAKGGLAGERRVGGIGAGRRGDPAAAGDKAAGRVIHHHELVDRLAHAAVLVGHGPLEGVDAGCGVGVAAGD